MHIHSDFTYSRISLPPGRKMSVRCLCHSFTSESIRILTSLFAHALQRRQGEQCSRPVQCQSGRFTFGMRAKGGCHLRLAEHQGLAAAAFQVGEPVTDTQCVFGEDAQLGSALNASSIVSVYVHNGLNAIHSHRSMNIGELPLSVAHLLELIWCFES